MYSKALSISLYCCLIDSYVALVVLGYWKSSDFKYDKITYLSWLSVVGTYFFPRFENFELDADGDLDGLVELELEEDEVSFDLRFLCLSFRSKVKK